MDMNSLTCSLESLYLNSKDWNFIGSTSSGEVRGIYTSQSKVFTMGDYIIQCNRKSGRISCLIVITDKMNQIIAKHARNKKDPVSVFLISLHLAEELATVKSDFEEQFDQQLKHLITEFADVTEEPRGFPPHRGHLDH